MNFRKTYSRKNGIVNKIEQIDEDIIKLTISVKDYYFPNKSKQEFISYIDCQVIKPNDYLLKTLQEKSLVDVTGHELTEVIYTNGKSYNYNILNLTDVRIYGLANNLNELD